jgi:hypothetical protein
MNEYSRDSRETGLSEFLFKVRGQGGIVFDYVAVARHAVHAQAEARALFGDRHRAPRSSENLIDAIG